jgi:hypothetical protein
MRYQQFASGAYRGATGNVFKKASQQEKALRVPSFEVSRSVITVQREFRARVKKDAPYKNNVFLNSARYSRCTVITDLDSFKRSTQKDFSCCYAILETGHAASH